MWFFCFTDPGGRIQLLGPCFWLAQAVAVAGAGCVRSCCGSRVRSGGRRLWLWRAWLLWLLCIPAGAVCACGGVSSIRGRARGLCVPGLRLDFSSKDPTTVLSFRYKFIFPARDPVKDPGTVFSNMIRAAVLPIRGAAILPWFRHTMRLYWIRAAPSQAVAVVTFGGRKKFLQIFEKSC